MKNVFFCKDSNKISSFGLHVFDKLHKLTRVYLEKNKCIDLHFGNRLLVLNISKIVEEQCCRPVSTSSEHLIEDIEAKEKQLAIKNAEILILEQAAALKSSEIATLKNTLAATRNEILALKKSMDALRSEKAASENAKDLNLQQKDNEISELKKTLTSNLQEIATLKTLQSHNHFLNATFAMLSSQIEQKDRSIVESSVKLSVLSEKISQKDNAINYLQQKVAMLKPCQENS